MLYNECLWMCTNYVTFWKKRPTVLVSRPSNLYFLALLARVWRKVCGKSKATKNEVAFNSGNFKVLLTFLQCIYTTTRSLANLCWLHNVASCWVCSSAFFFGWICSYWLIVHIRRSQKPLTHLWQRNLRHRQRHLQCRNHLLRRGKWCRAEKEAQG